MLLRGPGLRLLGWLRLWREGSPELVATYNDCAECQRTTFFTTFHVDLKSHQWQVRWPRSTAGAPIFSEGQEANGGQQVYALLDDEAGRVVLGTWAHFSTHGRPDTDVVYAYRVEYYGSHEATEPMVGAQARAFEQRLCGGQGVLFGLADGQDSALCRSHRRHQRAAIAGHTQTSSGALGCRTSCEPRWWFSARSMLCLHGARADDKREHRYYAPLNSVGGLRGILELVEPHHSWRRSPEEVRWAWRLRTSAASPRRTGWRGTTAQRFGRSCWRAILRSMDNGLP